MKTATLARSKSRSAYNPPKFRPRSDDPKTGYWYCWHEGKQNQLTRYGATRSFVKPGSRAYHADVMPAFNAWVEAYEAEQLAQANAAEAEAVASSGPVTVLDVCNLYLNTLDENKTYPKRAKRVLKTFCDGNDGKGVEINGIAKYKGFGRLPASACSAKVLDEWIAAHPRWTETETSLTPVKAAFNLALKKKLISELPFGDYEVIPSKSRNDYFSREQEAAFRKAIDNDAFADFFAASCELGSRPGELAALTASHVKEARNGLCWQLEWDEWKCGRVCKKSRTIFLPARWVEWTKCRLAELGEGERLFANDGQPWNKDQWGRAFRAVAKVSGIKGLCLYSARHTFITRALLAGWSASKVAAFCGTSELLIRTTYGHLINESQEMINLVESLAG